jgi:Pentapeptide repeats (9 copies)
MPATGAIGPSAPVHRAGRQDRQRRPPLICCPDPADSASHRRARPGRRAAYRRRRPFPRQRTGLARASRHARRPSPGRLGIRLNLAGATLIDFEFQDGLVADANFHWASFTGNAWFSGATFTGNALFDATFTGNAFFDGATFTGNALFRGAIFTPYAVFDGAAFKGGAGFEEATFKGSAGFDAATFSGRLSFERSRVVSPGAGHIWPTGWCLGPDGSGGYTVVREKV